MLLWLNSNPKTLISSVAVILSPDSGNGLYATGAINTAATIINIPHQFLLNKVSAIAHMAKVSGQSVPLAYTSVVVPSTSADKITETYAEFPVPELERLTSFQVLSFYLTMEMDRENSYWKPFLDSLPSMADFQHMPLVWKLNGDSKFEKLPKSTRIHANKMLKRLKGDYATLNQLLEQKSVHSLDFDSFVWIWICINSRCLYMDMPNGLSPDDNFTLVPYVDFLNHSCHDQCRVKIDIHGFKVITTSPYAEGDQLFFSYGPHSNEFLLCEYGFALDENSWDHIDVSADIDPLFLPRQKDFLSESGYLGEYTVNSSGPSFRTEVALATLQEQNPKESVRLQSFINGFNDGSMYRQRINRLLEGVLSRVCEECDDFDSDDSMVKTLYSGRRRIADTVMTELKK